MMNTACSTHDLTTASAVPGIGRIRFDIRVVEGQEWWWLTNMCVCAPMYTLEIPVCGLCIHLSIHTVHYFINIPHAHRYEDCAHENTDITVAYSIQTLLSRPVVYMFTSLFYTVCLQFYQPIIYSLLCAWLFSRPVVYSSSASPWYPAVAATPVSVVSSVGSHHWWPDHGPGRPSWCRGREGRLATLLPQTRRCRSMRRSSCWDCWLQMEQVVLDVRNINMSKTKIMKADTKSKNVVTVEGKPLEETDCFSHLSSIINMTGGTEEYGKAWIEKAHITFHE